MSEIIVKLTDSRIKLKGGEYVRDLVRCKDCKYDHKCSHNGADMRGEQDDSI